MRWLKSFAVVALVVASCAALAQMASPTFFLSAATTNSTLVQGTPGQIGSLIIGNQNATSFYLKLYDKATAPVCGTDTPVHSILIPTSDDFAVPLSFALNFIRGIGFCITKNIANSDTTAAGTGITINLGIK